MGQMVNRLFINSQDNVSLFNEATSRSSLTSKDFLDTEQTHLGILVDSPPTLDTEAETLGPLGELDLKTVLCEGKKFKEKSP